MKPRHGVLLDRPEVIRDAPPIGKPYPTPVGMSIRYHVDPLALPLGAATRDGLIRSATASAIAAGFRVVDVQSAVEQRDATWIVELAIAEAQS